MDIPNINNFPIITEAFAKSKAKLNNPNTIAFNDNPETKQFGRVLDKELNGVSNLNTQRHPKRHFMPINRTKVQHLPETYIPSNNVNKPSRSSIIEQYKTYKEDQLMSNPGGDNFFLSKTSSVIDRNYDHSHFAKRVGKDFSDAGNNLFNAVKDLGIGAKMKYVDKHGNINEVRKVGLVGNVVNFFKNAASGLSFGLYSQEGEVRPQGVVGKIKHLFKKVVKDAFVGDLVKGVPKSMIHIGEDIMFAGLNVLETVPDATIGNFEAGRKATTTVFDNTQVVMDFVTDVMPGGEAAMRVRSFKLAKGLKGLPIINNLTTSEKRYDKKELGYVRNTSFRKVIETIPSLIPFRI